MSVCTRMCVGGMGECVCACMFAGVWAHCFPAWPFGSQAAPFGAGHCPHHQPLSLQLHIRGMAAEAKGLLEEAGSQTLWRKNHGESQSWLSNCPGFTRGSEHDPDVWCGVCAEWWVPLLKESTCSFHLFACVFLTKRSHASGNNRHPTMIKISTPKKAHVSMLHSFIPLEGWYSLAMRPRPWQFVMVFPRPGAEWIWTAHREARGTGCKWLQEDEQRHFRRIWPCVP